MNSVLQREKECWVCHTTTWLEEHHIFGGANRKNSEKYGMKVYLCKEHHTGNHGVHMTKEFMDWLHREGQIAFEAEHTREEFMRIFGRNYL